MPQLAVTPTNLDFGSTDTEQSITISNLGFEILNWSLASNSDWITAGSYSGALSNNSERVTIMINKDGLTSGDYDGLISLTSNGGIQNIYVSMSVTPSQLVATPTNLDFGSTDTEQSITISNLGFETLNWSLTTDQSWLSASSITGSVSNESQEIIIVIVDRTGLNATGHSGTIDIASNGGKQSINVDIQVLANPILSCSPTTLDYGELSGQNTFNISNAGNGDLNWFLTPSIAWISIDHSSGTTTNSSHSTITVNIDRDAFFPGSYSGEISVSSNGGNENIDILVEIPQPQEHEPNNSYSQANLIGLNSSIAGNIGYNNDQEDWFITTFPEDGQFYIVRNNTSTGVNYASVGSVVIYNENMTNHGGVGYSSPGQISQSDTVTVLSNETYYVRVEDFPSRPGHYTIELFFIPSD